MIIGKSLAAAAGVADRVVFGPFREGIRVQSAVITFNSDVSGYSTTLSVAVFRAEPGDDDTSFGNGRFLTEGGLNGVTFVTDDLTRDLEIPLEHIFTDSGDRFIGFRINNTGAGAANGSIWLRKL